MKKFDRTDHAPSAKTRVVRTRTTAVIVHHLGIDMNKDGVTTVDEAIHFFTRDPEGLATVCLGGSYASKLPTIAQWKKYGVPTVVQGQGFVPYHFLIDRDAKVSRMLPIDARGAHAGAWNDRSVAIAFLGDFSKTAPSEAEIDAGVLLIHDIMAVWPGVEIFSHDETLKKDGHPVKGCPGAAFPLDTLRAASTPS